MPLIRRNLFLSTMARLYFFYSFLLLFFSFLTAQAQEVSVSPEEINVSLFPGETAEATLTLTNKSENALIWRPNTDAFALRFDRLNHEFSSILDKIPQHFAFAYDGRDFYIKDGGNNMYDGGNVLITNLAEQITYSDSLISKTAYFGEGSRYFTRHFPGLFVLSVDKPAITNFIVGGNLGADKAGKADVATIDTVINNTSYRLFIKRVYNAGVPSVNHLIMIENPGEAYHSYSLVTETDYHEVKQLGKAAALHYLLFAGKDGRYYTNAEIKEIAGAYLHLQPVELLPSWLMADDRYTFPDTLQPNKSLDYHLGIQPEGLAEGHYTTRLNFRTSATAYSDISVPVSLQYRNVLLKTQLKDSIVNEGFAEFTLALSKVFNAREGKGLTYTSQTRDENVIISRVEDAKLIIKEAGLGSSQVTVTATDTDGFSTSETFRLRVNDVPNLLVTLPDTTVSPIFEAYRIDLDTLFFDSDAEELQFSVSNSNEAVAQLNLENSILSLSNLGEGQSQISITADDGDGGITTTSFLYTADYTAGVQDLQAAGIQVFPNPIASEFFIGWQAGEPVQEISLHNLQGQMLYHHQPAYQEKQLSVPASGLPAGIYLLNVQTKQKRYSLRLVKP